LSDVDADWEHEPSAVALRLTLEREQEAELRRALPVRRGDVRSALVSLIAGAEGPSVSRWMEEHGQLSHMREFVAHRAPYQCKEADPHSFAIPRLAAGRAKSALLKIQL